MTPSEAFWVDLAPYIYQQSHLNASQEIDQITELLPLATKCRILDAACGVGRHAFECAQRNFSVTAYDISATLIEENKRKSLEKNLNIEWVTANMVDFCRPEFYDAIFSLFYSFGYCDSPDTDQQVLHKFYQSLRPNGKIIIQLMGRELLEKWLQPKYWQLESDGTFVLAEKQLNAEQGLLHETVFVLKEGNQKKYQITTRVYYASQMADLLHNAGFRQLQIFGSLNGIPYNEKAGSLVIVGQKPFKVNNMIRC